MTTPRHGERPFHIAHIDHTELDIELVDSKTGKNLGRPWMTLLIDAFSRKILAVYLTLDPPSYRSNLMVMRECVKKNGRLPQILVVDGGKDFSSVYFESFLAMFEITKKVTPPARRDSVRLSKECSEQRIQCSSTTCGQYADDQKCPPDDQKG